jgi:hypothetical protein
VKVGAGVSGYGRVTSQAEGGLCGKGDVRQALSGSVLHDCGRCGADEGGISLVSSIGVEHRSRRTTCGNSALVYYKG